MTLCSKCQIHCEDLVNFFGLLRKHELYCFGDKFEYCLSNPIQSLAHWIEYPIRKLRIFYDDLILYNFIHTSLVINSNIPCRKLYIVRTILLTGSIVHPSFHSETTNLTFSRIYKPIRTFFCSSIQPQHTVIALTFY